MTTIPDLIAELRLLSAEVLDGKHSGYQRVGDAMTFASGIQTLCAEVERLTAERDAADKAGFSVSAELEYTRAKLDRLVAAAEEADKMLTSYRSYAEPKEKPWEPLRAAIASAKPDAGRKAAT